MSKQSFIYGFTDFKNLNSNKKSKFIDVTITLDDLKKIISKIEFPKNQETKSSTDLICNLTDTTLCQKILSVFTNDNFLLGDKKFITQNTSFLEEKLNYFIGKDLPIEFCIMSSPFKIPVPLKTNRIFPDMGEILQLVQIQNFCTSINSIYHKGCRVNILAEGILGKFLPISKVEKDNYRDYISYFVDKLDYSDSIKIVDLDFIEETIPDFENKWLQKTAELENLLLHSNTYKSEFNSTFESIYRIVPTTMYSNYDLQRIYNVNLDDDNLAQNQIDIRQDIKIRATKTTHNYRAFIKLRDDFKVIENRFPNVIKLTLSPKQGNVGILPINKYSNILPYHGVAVLTKQCHFKMEYLIDLQNSGMEYKQVYFDEDKEKLPFYYCET